MGVVVCVVTLVVGVVENPVVVVVSVVVVVGRVRKVEPINILSLIRVVL